VTLHLVAKLVQEFHRRLAKLSVRLHGEGYETVAIGLHSCVGGLLLVVVEGRRGASHVGGAGSRGQGPSPVVFWNAAAFLESAVSAARWASVHKRGQRCNLRFDAKHTVCCILSSLCILKALFVYCAVK
jgi:hypothetical protein